MATPECDEYELPPENLDMEQAVIGAAMTEPGVIDRVVATGITADDFVTEVHRHIYRAIARLFDRDEPVQLLTVAEELRSVKELDEIPWGGMGYLTGCIRRSPTSAHAVAYARTVQELAKQRALISLALNLRERCHAEGAKSREIITDTFEALDQIEEQRPLRIVGESIGEIGGRRYHALAEEIAGPQRVRGARFGIWDVDKLTGGLSPPCFCVIMGDTSTGKTAMQCQLALESARFGMGVGYIDLESGRDAIHDKLVQQVSGVDLYDARTRKVDDDTRDERTNRLAAAGEQIRALPIHIEDPSRLQLSELTALIRRLRRDKGAELIVIDYFQKIAPTPRVQVWQDMRTMSNRLQSLAKQLNIVVVMASQVTRTEMGTWQARGAKDVEHDADVSITLLKELPEESEDLEPKERAMAYRQSPRARLLVTKSRRGVTGGVDLVWSGAWQRLFPYELAGHYIEELKHAEDGGDIFPQEYWQRIAEGRREPKPDDGPASWTGYAGED